MADNKTTTAESYLEERPKHIVLFKQPSERNTDLLCSVLNVKEQENSGARASRTILTSKNGVHSRVYKRMGVAATTLTKDEKQELESNEKVVKVFDNEIRKIPPFYRESEQTDDTDSLSAFLLGMKAAINSIENFRRGDIESSQINFGEQSVAVELATAQNLSWCLKLIGMNSNYSNATGKDVTVAVLDTGIDLEHPDFDNREFIDDVNVKSFVPYETVQDGNGHGTHCAGVIAGKNKPAVNRRYSVAPDVELLVGKVLDDSGSGYDDWIIDGMDWAQEQGSQIISMSLGSPRQKDEAFSDFYETVAERLLDEGVLVIAAAGNESNRPSERNAVGNPAACPSIMAVAAVDRQKKVGYFSCAELDSIGTLDICAPGVAVLSTWTGGGYRSISGTSMATPHVAGIAALYLEKNPKMSASDLWRKLIDRAIPIPDKSDYGSGLARVP